MQENNIYIFHHLTYGNVLWKVSSYGNGSSLYGGRSVGWKVSRKNILAIIIRSLK